MKIFKLSYFKLILFLSIFILFSSTFLSACLVQKPTLTITPTATTKSTDLYPLSSSMPFACDFTAKNDIELKTANSAVKSGQTICLYPGQYNSSDSYQLVPVFSGTSNSYITYLGLNQTGEIIFNNRNFLENKSYIIYQNINFHSQNNTAWFGTDSASNHIIFDNCICSWLRKKR